MNSRSSIEQLFASGARGSSFPLRYVVLIRPVQESEQPEAAIMVSVPKRLHKRANVRNRLRRRIREAYRLNKEPLRERCCQEGISLSLGLLYTSSEEADYHTIEDALRKIIQRLSVHA